MTENALKEAIKAAKDFLESAKQVELKSSPYYGVHVCSGRKTATLKRRSMDLTNALVALRK
jgi:hypothetical protein